MSEQATQTPGDSGENTASAATDPNAAAASQSNDSGDAGAGKATAPERPEGLPEEFFDPDSGVKWDEFLKDYSAAKEVKQKIDERAAAVPDDPAKYEKALPDDLELPEGFKLEDVQIDENDPAWELAAQTAKELGWTQDEFKQAAGLFTKIQAHKIAAENAQIKEFQEAEMTKLGDQSTARVDAVKKWIAANAKSEGQQAAVNELLIGADQITFFEDVMEALASQGVSNFRRSGAAAAGAEMSDEEWDKLGPTDKMVKGWHISRQRARA